MSDFEFSEVTVWELWIVLMIFWFPFITIWGVIEKAWSPVQGLFKIFRVFRIF